jgi:enoyl-[acyl-carrier protein] reductase I
MQGKTALIFGIANTYSLAYGIARLLADQGVRLGITYANETLKKRVEPIAEELHADFLIECDVSKEYDIKNVMNRAKNTWQNIDFVLHSIAYAPKSELNNDFVQTTRHGFLTAMDISVYSLISICNAALPLMTAGGSILTLSYYGAEKVVPNYNVMGVAKAALEATVRYLAYNLGSGQIRINAISAGPMRTLSSSAIGGIANLQKKIEKSAPLNRNVTLDDIAKTACFLFSDLASGTTGETIHVDAGMSIMAY